MLPGARLGRALGPCGRARIGLSQTLRAASSTSKPEDAKTEKSIEKDEAQPKQKKERTQAEIDEELKMKMAGISGDGGEAGVEYENGQPTSMKRSVRENMFRYI
ncbi:hypothetical protein HDK77DRAFT_190797 [Phyllosticta capitalensis]|uniref:Uncharacterized protein n=1 Tax=Phyllosticta capitalensis TaxID=121624 RepID=A0ABR1YW06_9PEZI